jgi:hypothetical protein
MEEPAENPTAMRNIAVPTISPTANPKNYLIDFWLQNTKTQTTKGSQQEPNGLCKTMFLKRESAHSIKRCDRQKAVKRRRDTIASLLVFGPL